MYYDENSFYRAVSFAYLELVVLMRDSDAIADLVEVITGTDQANWSKRLVDTVGGLFSMEGEARSMGVLLEFLCILHSWKSEKGTEKAHNLLVHLKAFSNSLDEVRILKYLF